MKGWAGRWIYYLRTIYQIAGEVGNAKEESSNNILMLQMMMLPLPPLLPVTYYTNTYIKVPSTSTTYYRPSLPHMPPSPTSLLSPSFNNAFNYNTKWYTPTFKPTNIIYLLSTNCKMIHSLCTPLSTSNSASSASLQSHIMAESAYPSHKPRQCVGNVVFVDAIMSISIIWPSPYSFALPRYFTLQSATYLQNCTYHKVLLSAANKSVLIVVSKEIEPPLNELSIGCLGLQYYWILAAYCNSRWKRRSLFGFLLPRSTAGQWAQKSPPSNHDVENLRRIEFIHENWHSTSLYHPLTGQREAGRFPNIP